jgi:sugar/nucleoside kinase (ribokinase family)
MLQHRVSIRWHILVLTLLQLQKDTHWKDVKDFLRAGNIDIDNVEIFPKSTTGWVRVYGRPNFDAAIRTSYIV